MILTKEVAGLMVHYRDSGDERILREVLERRCYRRAKYNFDVEPGERWLDLGANIGAFALYCRRRGALAVCYEPEPSNFTVLQKNVPEFELHFAAISEKKEPSAPFYDNRNPTDHARGSLLEVPRFARVEDVANVWGGHLISDRYDGVKVDIEGSEGPLIDGWLLPRCRKLVLEYSTSRDHSAVNLGRRLNILRSKFENVAYPPELDRAVALGGRIMTHPPNIVRFDRLIFCWGPR